MVLIYPALARAIFRHAEINDSIPDQLNVSVAGKDVGDSIHISSVTLPEGVKPVIDRDFTIATLIAPSALRSETDEAATAEAPAA